MSTTTDIRHLTDGELVGILDGGADAPDARRMAHLDRCDRCAEALEQLRADSALVRDYLDRAEFEDGGRPDGIERWRGTRGEPSEQGERAAHAEPVRDGAARVGPWASSWWKAAAVLVLVAGPLAAIPGVRTWIVETITAPAEPTGPAEPLTAAPVILRFTPDPGDFDVVFEPGTTGTIALERTGDAEAHLHAQGGDPETTVAAASLRIRNAAPATYRLRLPASITGVWIRVGERAVAVTDAQIDRRAVVELGNGTPKVR